MTTTVDIEEFRKHTEALVQKARRERARLIVTRSNQPVFAVDPMQPGDDEDIAYYKALEHSLSFWHDDADDHLFKS